MRSQKGNWNTFLRETCYTLGYRLIMVTKFRWDLLTIVVEISPVFFRKAHLLEKLFRYLMRPHCENGKIQVRIAIALRRESQHGFLNISQKDYDDQRMN